jgi:hypothetical protein
MLQWAFIVILLTIFWYWSSSKSASSDSPPTPPIRIPIIGHLHYLLMYPATKSTTQMYEMFKRFNKNGVLSFEVGTVKITIIGVLSKRTI